MSGAAPWVLLRGLSRAAGHWGGLPQQLAAATGRPVHCIDLPGNGAEAALRSPRDVRSMAAHARQRLHQRGVQEPVRLVGLSMGGLVAAEWASAWPDSVAGVALLNSSLRGLSPWYRRMRPPAAVALLGLLLSPAPPLRWERTIFSLTSNRPALRDATLPQWLALRDAAPVTHGNVWRQLWAAARHTALRPVPPVLVVVSQGDRLVDPRCSADLARAWQAPLAVHPTAGHDLPLDAPEWLVRQLADWAV